MSEGLIVQTPGRTELPGVPDFGLCRKCTVAHRQTLGCRRAPVGAEMLEQLDLNIAGVGR